MRLAAEKVAAEAAAKKETSKRESPPTSSASSSTSASASSSAFRTWPRPATATASVTNSTLKAHGGAGSSPTPTPTLTPTLTPTAVKTATKQTAATAMTAATAVTAATAPSVKLAWLRAVTNEARPCTNIEARERLLVDPSARVEDVFLLNRPSGPIVAPADPLPLSLGGFVSQAWLRQFAGVATVQTFVWHPRGHELRVRACLAVALGVDAIMHPWVSAVLDSVYDTDTASIRLSAVVQAPSRLKTLHSAVGLWSDVDDPNGTLWTLSLPETYRPMTLGEAILRFRAAQQRQWAARGRPWLATQVRRWVQRRRAEADLQTRLGPLVRARVALRRIEKRARSAKTVALGLVPAMAKLHRERRARALAAAKQAERAEAARRTELEAAERREQHAREAKAAKAAKVLARDAARKQAAERYKLAKTASLTPSSLTPSSLTPSSLTPSSAAASLSSEASGGGCRATSGGTKAMMDDDAESDARLVEVARAALTKAAHATGSSSLKPVVVLEEALREVSDRAARRARPLLDAVATRNAVHALAPLAQTLFASSMQLFTAHLELVAPFAALSVRDRVSGGVEALPWDKAASLTNLVRDRTTSRERRVAARNRAGEAALWLAVARELRRSCAQLCRYANGLLMADWSLARESLAELNGNRVLCDLLSLFEDGSPMEALLEAETRLADEAARRIAAAPSMEASVRESESADLAATRFTQFGLWTWPAFVFVGASAHQMGQLARVNERVLARAAAGVEDQAWPIEDKVLLIKELSLMLDSNEMLQPIPHNMHGWHEGEALLESLGGEAAPVTAIGRGKIVHFRRLVELFVDLLQSEIEAKDDRLNVLACVRSQGALESAKNFMRCVGESLNAEQSALHVLFTDLIRGRYLRPKGPKDSKSPKGPKGPKSSTPEAPLTCQSEVVESACRALTRAAVAVQSHMCAYVVGGAIRGLSPPDEAHVMRTKFDNLRALSLTRPEAIPALFGTQLKFKLVVTGLRDPMFPAAVVLSTSKLSSSSSSPPSSSPTPVVGDVVTWSTPFDLVYHLLKETALAATKAGLDMPVLSVLSSTREGEAFLKAQTERFVTSKRSRTEEVAK